MSLKKQEINAIILDMDGVLWRETQPIGDLNSIFNQIKILGYKVSLATNNSTRTTGDYLAKLSGFGVQVEPWQVISSAEATAVHLLSQFPDGGSLYVVGETGLIQTLSGYGFGIIEHPSEQNHAGVLAVVVGLDRDFSYQKLGYATQLIRAGVPFLATNTDPTLPTPDGLQPGAGAIVASVQTASAVEPFVIGKPAPELYRIALSRMAAQPEMTLVVGDRPETDIAGAQALGCRTALVLSGATSIQKCRDWQPAPDLIMDDLQSVLNSLV